MSPTKLSNTPLVSVIIPTKNASAYIEKCLQSLSSQSHKKIEMIIVDNYSDDNTTIIAKKYTNKVFTKGGERSKQRNYGVARARGKFIAWFDADMLVSPNVIKECIQVVQENLAVKALVIPEESFGIGFWAQCKKLEKRCYLGDEKIEGIRFIYKDIYNKVGRMSEDFISGEDWDITTRVRHAGYLISRVKSKVLHNEGKLRLFDNLKKKFYYSTKSLPYVQRHVKGPIDIIIFVFRPAYIRNWMILIKDPIHALGMFFMKFCEFSAGLLGFSWAKLGQLVLRNN